MIVKLQWKNVEVKSFYNYTINESYDFGILRYWIYTNWESKELITLFQLLVNAFFFPL